MSSSCKRLKELLGELDAAPEGVSRNCTTRYSRRSFVKASGTVAALAGLGYVSSRVPLAYAQENKITALTSINPVTIDGKWTDAEEWTDGYDITAPGNVWKVKHTPGDSGYIQILLDYMGDTETNASSDPNKCDSAGIRIDTLSDGGTKPHSDDYGFLLQWLSPDQPTLVVMQGTGTGWKDAEPLPLFSGASSMDASSDPYSDQPHLIYELQIPKSILPPSSSSVYCRLATSDAKTNATYAWPRGSDRDNPNTWGKMQFSQDSIPEFSSTLLPVALALGISLYLLKRRSERREEAQS